MILAIKTQQRARAVSQLFSCCPSHTTVALFYSIARTQSGKNKFKMASKNVGKSGGKVPPLIKRTLFQNIPMEAVVVEMDAAKTLRCTVNFKDGEREVVEVSRDSNFPSKREEAALVPLSRVSKVKEAIKRPRSFMEIAKSIREAVESEKAASGKACGAAAKVSEVKDNLEQQQASTSKARGAADTDARAESKIKVEPASPEIKTEEISEDEKPTKAYFSPSDLREARRVALQRRRAKAYVKGELAKHDGKARIKHDIETYLSSEEDDTERARLVKDETLIELGHKVLDLKREAAIIQAGPLVVTEAHMNYLEELKSEDSSDSEVEGKRDHVIESSSKGTQCNLAVPVSHSNDLFTVPHHRLCDHPGWEFISPSIYADPDVKYRAIFDKELNLLWTRDLPATVGYDFHGAIIDCIIYLSSDYSLHVSPCGKMSVVDENMPCHLDNVPGTSRRRLPEKDKNYCLSLYTHVRFLLHPTETGMLNLHCTLLKRFGGGPDAWGTMLMNPSCKSCTQVGPPRRLIPVNANLKFDSSTDSFFLDDLSEEWDMSSVHQSDHDGSFVLQSSRHDASSESYMTAKESLSPQPGPSKGKDSNENDVDSPSPSKKKTPNRSRIQPMRGVRLRFERSRSREKGQTPRSS